MACGYGRYRLQRQPLGGEPADDDGGAMAPEGYEINIDRFVFLL